MAFLFGVFGTALLCFAAVGDALAEDSVIDRYEARVAASLADQPHWATALVTTSPRLEQGFRTDFVRQRGAGGQDTWNYGNSRGLQVIPLRRVELRFSLPPFLAHTSPGVEDGFGDVSFLLKYRVYARAEEHGNAIVTAMLGASVPTGKSGNGSCCAILSPTLGVGKGMGRWVLTSTAGGSLPVSNAEKIGRQIVWNNAIQLHATRLLWVETEFNTTFFQGGKYDGKAQTFATPGIVVSRIPITRDGAGKPGSLLLTLGAGEQIALTHFNTYNHSPVFSARLRF